MQTELFNPAEGKFTTQSERTGSGALKGGSFVVWSEVQCWGLFMFEIDIELQNTVQDVLCKTNELYCYS